VLSQQFCVGFFLSASLRVIFLVSPTNSGMDFYKVGLRAGHAALSSTLRYVHGSQVLAGKSWQEKSFEIFN
jgi:hypothetical protein